mmetsp:Transcript_74990/g.243717  ORF Transcript_74990/g.243717 Transcript_74990/m.243717 type:complete len:205 (-) Transcript_74990:992-1606(-)
MLCHRKWPRASGKESSRNHPFVSHMCSGRRHHTKHNGLVGSTRVDMNIFRLSRSHLSHSRSNCLSSSRLSRSWQLSSSSSSSISTRSCNSWCHSSHCSSTCRNMHSSSRRTSSHCNCSSRSRMCSSRRHSRRSTSCIYTCQRVPQYGNKKQGEASLCPSPLSVWARLRFRRPCLERPPPSCRSPSRPLRRRPLGRCSLTHRWRR